MATKRKCVCCGKEYEFCPNCIKMAHPAWMTTFDNEVCKELFNIVSAYNIGLVNKAKVQAFVATHGITDYAKYTDSVREILEKAAPQAVEETSVIKEEPIIVENTAIEEHAQTVEEPVVIAQPVTKNRSRNKRKKKIGY